MNRSSIAKDYSIDFEAVPRYAVHRRVSVMARALDLKVGPYTKGFPCVVHASWTHGIPLEIDDDELSALEAGRHRAVNAFAADLGVTVAEAVPVTVAHEISHASALPARTCEACVFLTRRATCGEPEGAGLVKSFGIVWPPAGFAATCPAFKTDRRTTADRPTPTALP